MTLHRGSNVTSTTLAAVLGAAIIACPTDLFAQTAPPAAAGPAPMEMEASELPPPGGHLGVAVPIAVLGHTSTVIADDFFDLGLAPGVTIPLDRCWSFDFEFVAYDHLRTKRGAPTFVLDPGVVRNWGPFNAGMRVAVAVADGSVNNLGLIPIINKGFRVHDRLNWFIELDLPVFFSDARDNRVTLTPQLQTGVSF
jgi:hypothetical protein